jgi:hypothetical protein
MSIALFPYIEVSFIVSLDILIRGTIAIGKVLVHT